MIDHLGIGASDLLASRDFYLAALGPLGVRVLAEGPAGIGLGQGRKPAFWLYPATSPPAPLHLAFAAERRRQVDEFHRAALAAGATDHGAPGLRPVYHPNYYGAFVLGPDGHNLEVVCHRPVPAPVRYTTGGPMLLAGIRQQHPFAESGAGIPAQWQQFRALLPLPGQQGGTTYGVLCGVQDRGFDYLCGAEVTSFDALPAGLGRVRILPQRYAIFRHRGPVSELRVTWQRILEEWLPASGEVSAEKPDIEVYDERFDPVSGSGEVEIRVALAPDRRSMASRNRTE